jgi:hypothetical protein
MKLGHHCLVAQIAFKDTPIGVGATTYNSDKLAQRNLSVTFSDNPGSAATHMIPQTFDTRPTASAIAPMAGLQDIDELLINWGNTPVGGIASIYWPQVSAPKVLQLARSRYSSQSLSASDPNTIQCTVVRGLSYIPIPTGTGQNFAGLLTVDLPFTVVKGWEFNILVYRLSTISVTITPPVKPPAFGIESTIAEPISIASSESKILKWRYITGSFQIKIPVSTALNILPSERNAFAIFKYRLQQTSPTSRWYPVLVRYSSYLSARVDGLGRDAASIGASLFGAPPFVDPDQSCGCEKKKRRFVVKFVRCAMMDAGGLKDLRCGVEGQRPVKR